MEDAQTLPAVELVLRLGMASLFGMVLGMERELRGKDAGLRTHMLVSLGAAATTIATMEFYEHLLLLHPETEADPLRVVEGVIAAVGFLGAGAIMRGNDRVQNLTTAANIWLCGAIGLTCGTGHYVLAAIIFAFTVAIVVGLGLVERAIERRSAP